MTRDEIQSTLRQEYDTQRWFSSCASFFPARMFCQPAGRARVRSRCSAGRATRPCPLGRPQAACRVGSQSSDRIDLLRNRVGLRNLVARFIDQAEYHASWPCSSRRKTIFVSLSLLDGDSTKTGIWSAGKPRRAANTTSWTKRILRTLGAFPAFVGKGLAPRLTMSSRRSPVET